MLKGGIFDNKWKCDKQTNLSQSEKTRVAANRRTTFSTTPANITSQWEDPTQTEEPIRKSRAWLTCCTGLEGSWTPPWFDRSIHRSSVWKAIPGLPRWNKIIQIYFLSRKIYREYLLTSFPRICSYHQQIYSLWYTLISGRCENVTWIRHIFSMTEVYISLSTEQTLFVIIDGVKKFNTWYSTKNKGYFFVAINIDIHFYHFM